VTVTTHAPIPTVRDELWHYAPLDEINAHMARSVTPGSGIPASVSPASIDAMAGAARPRLVFVNGFYAAGLSDCEGLPVGVRCGVSDTDHGGGPDAATVTVDDGVRIEEPIHVVHVAAPDSVDAHSVLSRARTIIDLGDDARLAVVETFGGLDGSMTSTLTEASTTIRLGDRAELVHYRIQIEATAATHLGHTHIDQGAGSVVAMTSVTLGGDIARNAVEVHLDAPGARTELTGINVTGGHQRHDTVVTVDHAAPRCTSSQRFTGVVDDHGRGSFSGEIIVQPGTTATDAHQSSRNLVLDPNAEADARPWLRILADDVRCTHGATVGRLDEDALHYLRSRGISLAATRAMLIDAFLRDVTDSIAHEPVRDHVAALVAAAASSASTAPTHSARSVDHP
jgi:Fe-S cluster assembly protein SufD